MEGQIPVIYFLGISRLPERALLDAAHIVMDAIEQCGQPIISNGLPLTKIHTPRATLI
jgi:hypothetical protein